MWGCLGDCGRGVGGKVAERVLEVFERVAGGDG